jgi:hypothetical protein
VTSRLTDLRGPEVLSRKSMSPIGAPNQNLQNGLR